MEKKNGNALNKDKLPKISANARIGGKGTVRRKHKAVHKKATGQDVALQSALKRLGVTNIPGIEEVNMFLDNGNILHFAQPKVQAAAGANTFVVNGNGVEKPLQDLLPGIISQLGSDSLSSLKKLAEAFAKSRENLAADGESKAEDEDIPELVETA